jgi:hypothetical protein
MVLLSVVAFATMPSNRLLEAMGVFQYGVSESGELHLEDTKDHFANKG